MQLVESSARDRLENLATEMRSEAGRQLAVAQAGAAARQLALETELESARAAAELTSRNARIELDHIRAQASTEQELAVSRCRWWW